MEAGKEKFGRIYQTVYFCGVMTKAERTKHFIVEKAAPIINKKGMAATSINDITEATKLTKGSVYGNFESKDEICLEAFDYLVKRLSADIEMAIGRATSNRDKLYALFDFYLGTITQNNNYGCPLMNFGIEADDTNPQIKSKVNKAIIATENRIAKIIRAGIEAGEFKQTMDAESFATKTFAMIEGGLWIARIQGNSKQLQTIIDLLKQEIKDYSR
jgi:TetR/AcrR family transcriptional regulator, transcriptional repressor for nem operon